MKITPVVLVSLASASTILSMQGSATARTVVSNSIFNSDDCDIIAEREGEIISSSMCSISKQESVEDFELPELVKLVEFSNRHRQKRSSAVAISRKGLPFPRPDRLMVSVERLRVI